MVLDRKLQLSFKTTANQIRYINIPNVRDDIGNTDVVNAMDGIINSQALQLGSGIPSTRYRARKIITSENNFPIVQTT